MFTWKNLICLLMSDDINIDLNSELNEDIKLIKDGYIIGSTISAIQLNIYQKRSLLQNAKSVLQLFVRGVRRA